MSKFLKITLLMAIALLTFDCSSSDDNENGFIGTIVDKEFTIANSGVVNYYLGDLGESGTASITVNPEHFSVNRLFESQYTYEPSDDYVGKDYVELYNSRANINVTTGNMESRFFKTRITIIVTE